MRICEKCGVQLEDEVHRCPLCGHQLGTPVERTAPGRPEELPEAPEPPSPAVRWIIWKIISLLLASVAAVVFAADFAFGRAVTWSAIPLASIGLLWLTAGAIIALGRRIQLLFLAETVAVLLYLAILNSATSGRSWFPMPGAPLTLLVTLLVSVVVQMARAANLSALSVVAVCLVGGGLTTMGIEAVLKIWLERRPLVSWSLLTTVCTFPPTGLLLYLRWKLKDSGQEIRKLFHL